MRHPAYFALFLAAVCSPAFAQEPRIRGHLHLSGYSHHFDAPDANANLYGAGFTWYRSSSDRLLRAWEVDVFRDSGRKPSGFVGHSWTLPFRSFNVGVTGALMYHRNFEKHNRLRLFPVALPFLETKGRHARFRMYYVPGVRSPSDHQIAIQAIIPIWR